MSKTSKIVLGIIVVVIIGFAVWWFTKGSSTNVGTDMATATPMTATDQNSQTPTNTPTVTNSDTSDASINADLNAIDSQTKGLNSDNASADTGLNSQNQ